MKFIPKQKNPIVFLFFSKIFPFQTWPKTFFSMFVQQSVMSVDTFFLLSGFLLAWSCFREIERKKGKLNASLMFFHRVIRTLPLKVVLVLLAVSVFRYFGSGPFWDTYSKPLQFYCEKNWWKTMLFIQNYAQPEEMVSIFGFEKLNWLLCFQCLGHSWYIATDMQLYILSPIAILPLWKWGNKVIVPLIIICLLSVIAIIIIFYHEGYDEVIGWVLKIFVYPWFAQGSKQWLCGITYHIGAKQMITGVARCHFSFSEFIVFVELTAGFVFFLSEIYRVNLQYMEVTYYHYLFLGAI